MKFHSRQPNQLALSWIQQAEHIGQLRSWFRRQGVPTQPTDCLAAAQLICQLEFQLTVLPWQFIPTLDNWGDRTQFTHDPRKAKQFMLQDPRTRDYTWESLTACVQNGTVEPPTVYWEQNKHKPSFYLIDGRTRLRTAWCYRKDCPIAITTLDTQA